MIRHGPHEGLPASRQEATEQTSYWVGLFFLIFNIFIMYLEVLSLCMSMGLLPKEVRKGC